MQDRDREKLHGLINGCPILIVLYDPSTPHSSGVESRYVGLSGPHQPRPPEVKPRSRPRTLWKLQPRVSLMHYSFDGLLRAAD
jgi:hypothetical protein